MLTNFEKRRKDWEKTDRQTHTYRQTDRQRWWWWWQMEVTCHSEFLGILPDNDKIWCFHQHSLHKSLQSYTQHDVFTTWDSHTWQDVFTTRYSTHTTSITSSRSSLKSCHRSSFKSCLKSLKSRLETFSSSLKPQVSSLVFIDKFQELSQVSLKSRLETFSSSLKPQVSSLQVFIDKFQELSQVSQVKAWNFQLKSQVSSLQRQASTLVSFLSRQLESK